MSERDSRLYCDDILTDAVREIVGKEGDENEL